MTSEEIRQSFLDFFESKEHSIVPSSSLMPSSPNLLFTNAGMNQFVPYFLGERNAPFKRAADTQKCIRAGGKHNDLEDVGFDTYHHTFFEMLGNWSFGDYFKKEAIEWSWELLTKVWKFPKERLYVTVYKPDEGDPAEFDQEAHDFWKTILEKEGLDTNIHIVNGNKADNFWMMGETGPCGPCSEIHVDLTPDGQTKGSLVNQDSPYCIEIWNLVFIQFNAEPNGSFKPLAAQHVDTGMGFERVAGIFATTKNFTDFTQAPSNYDSDLFADIFSCLTEWSGHEYGRSLPADPNNMSETEMKDCAFRVLADHTRTLCCSIADGIIPGNSDRNYVLRRILRRAVHWADRIGLPEGSFTKLADPVISKLGSTFPELIEHKEMIKRVIASEENSFARTIKRGVQLFEKIAKQSESVISGDDAFTLYDTYGFPLDLTELVAREHNLTVDTKKFNERLEEQREKGRASQEVSVITVSEDNADKEATPFIGYERENFDNVEVTITDIVQNKKDNFVVLDKTPFYAEMGGQLGDHGTIQINGSKVDVVDTIKDDAGRYLHKTKSKISNDLIGKQASASLNQQRRLDIQRHHSATHVLHWALRKVLGTHIHQAGSLVDEDRLRFDFSHFEQPSKEQLKEIETIANQRILENASVQWYEVPFDEKPENCIAFFGEKYGNIVRVVDIGGWSVELCGGTHVNASGEIGLLKVVQESAIAAGTRRIEAVAGETAFQLAEQNAELLQSICNKLSCKTTELESRFSGLLEQRNNLEKELKKVRQKESQSLADDLANTAKKKGDIQIVSSKVATANPNEMRQLAVQISKKLGESTVILGGDFNGKATVLALCSPQAIEAGHKAGNIVRDITSKLDGKGGGKPDFAMGGGKNVQALSAVLSEYVDSISN